MYPYKVVHTHQDQEPFELYCTGINRALEIAQIQLDTHSEANWRTGSLRGEGCVEYWQGGKKAGTVEVMILCGDTYERIGG